MTAISPPHAMFLDQLPIGILLVGRQGRIHWANAWIRERLSTPVTPDTPLEALVKPEARGALKQALERTFLTHLPTFLSQRIHPQIFQLLPPFSHPDLDTTPHHVYLVYFGEVENQPLVGVMVEDLTARWVAEAQLRQQLLRQRTLYNAVSPLNRPDPQAPQRSLEALLPLFHPDHLALYLVEERGGQTRLGVALGQGGPLPEIPPEDSLVRWALKNRRRCIWRPEDQHPLAQTLRPLDPQSQFAVAIPLETDGMVVGVLTLESAQPEALDEEDLALLQNVADHVTINLQWQRSFERERRLHRLADTLRETGLQLTTTLDSDRIQDLILRFVADVVPYDSACILMQGPDGAFMVSRHRGYDRFGIGDEVLRSLRLRLDEVPNLKRMAQTHQPLVIPDTTQYEEWVALPTSQHIKSWVGAPIVAQERLLGFLALDHSQPGFYHAEHAQVLALFAYQAALALENAWLYEQRYQEAITDPLTGLANRRYLQHQLEREVARSQRFGRPLSLLMVDLDDFKLYNDTFGHPAGDKALQVLAQTLEENIRRVDLAARYGGEEFLIVLPETPSEKALVVAQRIVEAVRSLHKAPDSPLRAPLSVSVGVATMPDHAETLEDLILAADVALYYAKRSGKGRAALYSPEFASAIPHHHAFES